MTQEQFWEEWNKAGKLYVEAYKAEQPDVVQWGENHIQDIISDAYVEDIAPYFMDGKYEVTLFHYHLRKEHESPAEDAWRMAKEGWEYQFSNPDWDYCDYGGWFYVREKK